MDFDFEDLGPVDDFLDCEDLGRVDNFWGFEDLGRVDDFWGFEDLGCVDDFWGFEDLGCVDDFWGFEDLGRVDDFWGFEEFFTAESLELEFSIVFFICEGSGIFFTAVFTILGTNLHVSEQEQKILHNRVLQVHFLIKGGGLGFSPDIIFHIKS